MVLKKLVNIISMALSLTLEGWRRTDVVPSFKKEKESESDYEGVYLQVVGRNILFGMVQHDFINNSNQTSLSAQFS